MCRLGTPDTKTSLNSLPVTSWSYSRPVLTISQHGGADPLERYRSPAARYNRAHVGRVLEANMTAHVDLDELLTIRAVTVVDTLPLFEDWVEFVPIGTSLESQCVG